MSDLLKDYFKRDLSEAEEDRLSEELLASEENTDVFLKEARAFTERSLRRLGHPFGVPLSSGSCRARP
jgi:Zn-dependent peptidase ImmA (M78 family)